MQQRSRRLATQPRCSFEAQRAAPGKPLSPTATPANAQSYWEAVAAMGYRPTSRTDALLEELCTKYGWCLRPEDRHALIAAQPQDRETITDSIIRAEFGEDGVLDEDKRTFLVPIVDDWLFDSTGRGARARLPH